jgi:hypothetical protein
VYRINLHPEFAERRRAAKQRRVEFFWVVVLLAMAVILVSTTVMNTIVLDEQTRSLDESLPRLSQMVDSLSATQPEVSLARELIAVRERRVDWSPQLAAVSQEIPNSLTLSRVSGRTATQSQPARFILEGEVRSGKNPLNEVSAFVDSLRNDQRVVRNFPAIKVGRIKERDSGQFELICESVEGGT